MRHSIHCVLLAAVLLLGAVSLSPASADIAVYSDTLTAGWADWSWGGVTRDFARSTPVHGGTASIAVTYTGGWSGVQFGRLALLDVSGLDTFRFYVHGGSSGGQQIEVQVGNNGTGVSVTLAITPVANMWTRVDVPLLDLGTPAQVNYIYWFNNTPGSQPIFYLDDVAFVASGAATPTPVPPSAGPSLSVDVNASRHPISPAIYGMNFADESLAAEIHLPVRRWGGNATTRYNWQNDTSNHAMDWFFENIPNDNPSPGTLPDGSSSDQFIEQDRRTGTATLLTVPLIGWTPKSRALACGFSIGKYGTQQSADPFDADCGNGVAPNGSTEITGNDPHDTSVAIDPSFVQQWMTHLSGRYGTASNGGVALYDLDNEPMLWDDTHRDAHPAPTSYDEMRDRTYSYGAVIKATDPAAQTLGPAEWGWTGYFWSALDWAPGGVWWNSPQDRLAHGNVPFAEWYLQQMRAYELLHGTRILDYLDEHYYPQASGVSLSPAGDAATQALRLRSTRSLWDPTYVDESWIADVVRLIPRMHEWVTRNYPNTKVALTEYNWGALDHINGALAQADVLGIFGREGVDLATLWDPPTAIQPGAYAFRMFLNYDGAAARFGDVSVGAFSSDQDQLAVYAAQRNGDADLTLLVINKTTVPLVSTVTLAQLTAAPTARVYRYSPASLSAIVREVDQPLTPSGFTTTFPPSSITLLVLPANAAATPTATASATSTRTASLTLSPTLTPPPTATPTQVPILTATGMPTPGPGAVSGHIRYYSNAMPVNAVAVQLQGAALLGLQTDSSGQFSVSGLAMGDWRVVPQKLGDVSNGVSALDAVYALQAAVGLRTLTAHQRMACDVNGSGTLSALDASLILQYRVGLIARFPVAQACGSDWLFDPAPAAVANQQLTSPSMAAGACQAGAIAFHPLVGSADNQDFVAMAFGDCNGDWQPAGGGGGALAAAASVRIDPVRVTPHHVRLRLSIDAAVPFNSAELRLHYDPQQLVVRRVRQTGSARHALVQTYEPAPGKLAVALASAVPLPTGAVLLLQFDVHDATTTPRVTVEQVSVSTGG